LPKLTADSTVIDRLVEEVEHAGDDPVAYNALAAVIRSNQLSAGLDNPSIRARIALADLDEVLDPILTTLDGAEVRLSNFRNRTILLAFWATWCVPCRAELSKLEKISAASPDLAVLAVTWEPRETVADFLRAHPYHLAMFIDSGHKLSDRFHVDTLPATVKLDPLHPRPGVGIP
jgi:thiol-disulfide isomerase/thioredoxin